MIMSDGIPDFGEIRISDISGRLRNGEKGLRARISRAVSMTPVSAQKGPRIAET